MNFSQARHILLNRDSFDRGRRNKAVWTIFQTFPLSIWALFLASRLAPRLTDRYCVWANARAARKRARRDRSR
jgi:hypothetical protein